ncbi:recombinase family protein [Streptomyces europaeiscabiei]|uniref:recombinase family protein n=1 Tax=Streptomyces europaeiscabiei TaxID=146819 RepID=UPI0029A9822C|nr:recombinase family protein [Streptomyces europaeiscabiei]MDX3637338.1 recombinase family protein [Streptomyces europaeiscabiei]MDX3655291.1 recombinase family protein [Streptomyces europaeiscabiei]
MPFAPEYLHLVFQGVRFEALLYGRNSDDAGGGGGSVEDQLANGRTLCAERDWRVAQEFNDTDLSASRHAKKARGNFEALLAAVTGEAPPAGVRRIVVAYEASRYYRDLEAYVRLRNACMATDTLLCYDGQVYDLSRRDDRKATALHAVDAEDEVEGIYKRNVRTMSRTAREGMPHGKALYGYIRDYKVVNGRRRCTGQTEDPVRGPYVLQALQRIDEGHSLKALVRWLASEPGAARHDGKPWSVLMARKMILNRAYLGERLHLGTYGQAAWKPIKGLDTPEGRALFNRVTAKITDPARNLQRGTEPKHLLSYIALCGECGDHAVLQWLSASSRRKASLYCSEKRDTSIGENLIDAVVEEAVIDWFSDKNKARAALVPRDDKVAEMAAATQKLINTYEEQLNEARRLAEEFDEEAGRFKMPAATLASMELRLGPKLEAAQKKLQTFTGASPLLLRLLEAGDPDLVWNGRPATEDEPEAPGLTMEQKREVLRKIVTVRLYKAQGSGRRPLDDDRIRLAFSGEPGFRDQPLRVPESGAAPAGGTG